MKKVGNNLSSKRRRPRLTPSLSLSPRTLRLTDPIAENTFQSWLNEDDTIFTSPMLSYRHRLSLFAALCTVATLLSTADSAQYGVAGHWEWGAKGGVLGCVLVAWVGTVRVKQPTTRAAIQTAVYCLVCVGETGFLWGSDREGPGTTAIALLSPLFPLAVSMNYIWSSIGFFTVCVNLMLSVYFQPHLCLSAMKIMISLICYLIVIYRLERGLKYRFVKHWKGTDKDIISPITPPSVTFKKSEATIGTEHEEIIAKLDKIVHVLRGTDCNIDWAREALSVLVEELASGKNIYRQIAKIDESVSRESVAFLRDNCFTEEVAKLQPSTEDCFPAEHHTDLLSLSPLLESIGTEWNLDVFTFAKSVKGSIVSAAGDYVVEKFGLREVIGVSRKALKAFCEKVEENYWPNPYHNATHAVDVFHSFLYLLRHSPLFPHIPSLELFSTLISALSHDLAHPGLTNRFLINSKHPLSLTCNVHTDSDKSVLEMMHCAATFRLLTETGVLSSIDRTKWVVIRKTVIDLILATDMAAHFDLLGNFRTVTVKKKLDVEEFEDRLWAYKMTMKCADIGHAAKCFQLHEKWATRITEEFFLQGDKEKSLNLPLSTYCDRDSTDTSQCQIGFLQSIVHPLYDAVAAAMDSAEWRQCVAQVKQNQEQWESRGKRDKPKAALLE